MDTVISPTGRAAAASGPRSHAAGEQAHLCKGDRAAVPSSHAAGASEQRWHGGTGAAAAAAEADSEPGSGAAGASRSGAAEGTAAAGGSRAGQEGAEQEGSDTEMPDAPGAWKAPEGAEGSKTRTPRQARSRQATASQQVGAALTLPCCTVSGSSLPAQLGCPPGAKRAKSRPPSEALAGMRWVDDARLIVHHTGDLNNETFCQTCCCSRGG